MKKIVQEGDPVLRQVAKEIEPSEIQTEVVQNILKDMVATLRAEERGVAIAAPQIGVSLRIFIVAGKIFSDADADSPSDLIFINPEILETYGEPELMSEGCLSCGNLYGQILRHKEVKIRAYDENGKQFAVTGSGLLAQIFQHETDHLNGALFIDKAQDIEKVDLSKNPKKRRLGEEMPEATNE